MATKIYAVKAVKSFQGMEGTGYSCSLYRNGKRIGIVTDTANGGEADYYLNSGEKEILDAHCAKLPKEPWEFKSEHLDPKGMSIDCDIFVTRLVDEFETNAKLKKICKTKTLFSLKDDENKDDFWSYKLVFSPKVKTYLQKKYGFNLAEIINERFS